MDKKTPRAVHKQPGGWDLQGKRIKPAGQKLEGEQEEQMPKENGLRWSIWKNKTKRPAKTEGRLREPQPVADPHILIISHQTLTCAQESLIKSFVFSLRI